MKISRLLSLLAAPLTFVGAATAQTYAPTTNFANVYFTGVLTGATGGANADGTFTDFFSPAGTDYTVSQGGAFSSPVAYTYANTGADSATITESGVSIALTFTSATGGTFLATYGSGGTQSGAFTLSTPGETPAITNFSTLLPLAAGASVTTGFYIGGGVPRTVLIRAVGPGLAAYGVPNTLATPRLTLWSGTTTTQIQAGGSTTSALQSVYSAVGAFSLPIGSNDQAMVATLNPGAYTAMVNGGTGGASGTVLVEVYFLD